MLFILAPFTKCLVALTFVSQEFILNFTTATSDISSPLSRRNVRLNEEQNYRQTKHLSLTLPSTNRKASLRITSSGKGSSTKTPLYDPLPECPRGGRDRQSSCGNSNHSETPRTSYRKMIGTLHRGPGINIHLDLKGQAATSAMVLSVTVHSIHHSGEFRDSVKACSGVVSVQHDSLQHPCEVSLTYDDQYRPC